MRVKVVSGDGNKLIGYGNYDEDVTVYFVVMPNGDLLSRENAEEKPSDKEVAESGGELYTEKDNPKIVLDNGKVVYGCQVWWKEDSQN